MILSELTNSEGHPVYKGLAIENVSRHYDFLRSVVFASLAIQRPFLSQQIIKALNYHAIACLHADAGEYRPCAVKVGDGDTTYLPPDFYRVQSLMDDFVNLVNLNWREADPLNLAAFVLWRLNWIHPFVNGNGRTARAAAYYVICVRAGGWLPGTATLPQLLVRERVRYVEALKTVDQTRGDLASLHALISELVNEQLGTPVDASNVVEKGEQEES